MRFRRRDWCGARGGFVRLGLTHADRFIHQRRVTDVCFRFQSRRTAGEWPRTAAGAGVGGADVTSIVTSATGPPAGSRTDTTGTARAGGRRDGTRGGAGTGVAGGAGTGTGRGGAEGGT